MIDFVEIDAEKIEADILNAIEKQTGEILEDGDPRKTFALSLVPYAVGFYNTINYIGNMNLIQESEGIYLDAIGKTFGAERLPAETATTELKFTLSAEQPNDTIILSGTRVTPGEDIYFVTMQDLKIAAGETEGIIAAMAAEAGERYNGFLPGTINKMMDQIPFCNTVENTTTSEGGKEIEDDESYRTRIKIAPESYSVAGPTGAYEYYTKSVSQTIIDVSVESEIPGTVSIYPLTESGILSEELKAEIVAAVTPTNRRPLTDYVVITAPEAVDYEIDFTYTVPDSENENNIKKAVEEAVENYVIWQRDKMGKTINPDELRKRVLNAGAETIQVAKPEYTNIEKNKYANNIGKSVVMKE